MRRFPHVRKSEIAFLAIAIVAVGLAAGHPAITEVIGGALIVWVSILVGSYLVRRMVGEADPDRELALDFGLVLVVLLGLAGVTVIGLALPIAG